MFAVIFEVQPKAEQWDAYLGEAKLLKPELEQIDGFVDNVRYRSLTRDGWLLSLSSWRDEKALVRWRTKALHHDAQEKGRFRIFNDYHLRVGQIIRDSELPAGCELREQRLDETEVGEATVVTLVTGRRPADIAAPAALASWLGLDITRPGLVAWDVLDAVLTPGDLILLTSWRDKAAVEAYETSAALPPGARLRSVRILRDYGMFDRREAPQYYPDVPQSAGAGSL
ncbi:antibiotic biosynthesis monooxygenase family protein [Chelatococcus sp. GCM10030263]|uniref:antibiotic biosynthesis monooxygenase family protein n=1 Tax=Chelatococcus sp. GCM10030263 TaxID=3273387 RepID=UPI00360B82AC